MENQAGGFQGFLGSLFAVVISYIAPIYDYVIIIAYIFLINFIIGLIEDIIVKHKTFKCKKFYFSLSASMDRINWNSKLVILVKHIIFTEPFIADGRVFMCFLG